MKADGPQGDKVPWKLGRGWSCCVLTSKEGRLLRGGEVGPEEQGGFWYEGKKRLLGEGRVTGWPCGVGDKERRRLAQAALGAMRRCQGSTCKTLSGVGSTPEGALCWRCACGMDWRGLVGRGSCGNQRAGQAQPDGAATGDPL